MSGPYIYPVGRVSYKHLSGGVSTAPLPHWSGHLVSEIGEPTSN